MSDTPSPFEIHPDDHLEARITAYVFGESSPFESAELESLIEKSPELKLFLTRTRTLHTLLTEAETTSNLPSEDWKLPAGKKLKIARAMGENPEIPRLPVELRHNRRLRKITSFAIAACVLFAAFITIRRAPWEHVAEAVIEVKPRGQYGTFLGSNTGGTSSPSPAFFSTEFEKIKSRNTLKQVVSKLDLASKWNTDQETAIKKLRDSINTKTIKGTDLISIKVRQRNEEDAKQITRELALGYRDYRKSLEEKTLNKGIAELKKAVREQEDKVEERRKVLTTIARTKNLVYYAGDRSLANTTDESQKADYDLTKFQEIESEKVQLESQIESLLKYDSKQLLIYASGLDVPDNIVKTLYPQELELKRQIDGLKASGLADDHPTVKANQKVLSAMKSQLDEGVVNLRTRLQGQLESSKERLSKAEEEMKASNSAAVSGSIDMADYADAKRNFETDQALLDTMKIKLIGEEMDSEIEPDSIVIHDIPPASKTMAESSLAARKLIPVPAAREAAQPSAALAAAKPMVHIGGQIQTLGPREFKEGLTLGDAIASAGDATEFGSKKRVKLFRDGKIQTYDLTDKALAQIKLQPNDTIEIPQKQWLGCGASRDELTAAPQEKSIVTSGNRSGDAAIARNNVDAIPYDPKESIAEAQELRKTGKYDEARDLLERSAATAPNDERIKQELGYLDDPIRTNGAISYEHTKNVDEVRRNLYTAQGNYDLGNYDAAQKAYENTLRLDPYNTAARRGMKKIASTKSDYYRAAYDHTRTELLAEVDQAWDDSVPAERSADFSPQPEEEGKKHADTYGQARAGVALSPLQPINLPELFSKQNAEKEMNSDFDMAGNFSDGSRLSGDSWTNRFKTYTGYRSSNQEIDLTESPPQIELEGFVNYGAPIVENTDGTAQNIKMPLFRSNSLANNGNDEAPKQIKITTKFVDISQANDKELAFDWITKPSNPTLTIRSGVDTKVDVIREFDYPTEFEPAALPNELTKTDTPFPVTPATPTAFETVNTGKVPLLEDIPIVGRLFQEKSLIDLSEESLATQDPFSTFSLNISDASFQLARAAIEKGERPNPASIKPEQFYNAVDYGDPAPSSLEPVAAAIDQTAHPVIPGRNLVRIGIRTASTGRSAAQPLRLTLVVDQSGSMVRADRRAAMATALAQLATLLTENDQLTVIGFSRTPRLLADSLPGNEAGKLPDLINQTANEGGTNLEQAINLASELALRHKLDGAQNRIVLFTDGAANLGNADPARLSKKIEALRQQDLSFDIAGIGTNDLNDRLLSDLARHGNGRYYLVGENTGESLARQLAGAFRPAAGNVKVQVKLNPARVGNYKLIGFEKDRLKTEDFRNDSVDAAELAADEAGVAMYQIEQLAEGSGEIGEVSVRFRNMTSGEMVERTWTIPYEPSAPAFDKAAPKTQLATLSLLAAQKLQGGPLADAIDFNKFSTTISTLKQTYNNAPKAQQMLTLIDDLK